MNSESREKYIEYLKFRIDKLVYYRQTEIKDEKWLNMSDEQMAYMDALTHFESCIEYEKVMNELKEFTSVRHFFKAMIGSLYGKKIRTYNKRIPKLPDISNCDDRSTDQRKSKMDGI